MTDRQARFCREYVKDRDATAAYIRAGYRPERALHGGRRLMAVPAVAVRIDELTNEEMGDVADAREVLRYLTRCMRGQGALTGEDAAEPPLTKEQMRAAEILARRYGLLADKGGAVEAVPVIVIDFSGRAQHTEGGQFAGPEPGTRKGNDK